MSITLIVLIALLLDAWLGEPRRFHPLVEFGKLAEFIERQRLDRALVQIQRKSSSC